MKNRNKEWVNNNREYVRAYKKAWNRLLRNNPDYPPEFPEGRQVRTAGRRSENMDKPLVMRDKGTGFCKLCESKSKNYYCDYCIATYPQLVK